MIKKEKLIHDIESKLNTFQYQLNKMQKPGFNIHAIDVDLLKKKTIELYDKLIELEHNLTEKQNEKTINLPERMPKGEIPEKATIPIIEKEENKETESILIKEGINKDQPDSEKKTEEITEMHEEIISKEEPTISPAFKEEQETEKTKEEIPLQQVEEAKKVEPEQSIQTNPVEDKDATQSAFDLFTAGSEATIGDKFGSSDEQSIADRMQKSQVVDLRQVIGINEKFLFINELFNGDMGRYNKAIDELNSLKTQQGINTYLLEIKVSNQWSDDNEAFLKFKNLLERKST